MIVKCQRSLASTLDYETMLVYTEDQDMLAIFSLQEDWAARFAGDLKFYAEVDWPDAKRRPTFVRRVPDQPW